VDGGPWWGGGVFYLGPESVVANVPIFCLNGEMIIYDLAAFRTSTDYYMLKFQFPSKMKASSKAILHRVKVFFQLIPVLTAMVAWVTVQDHTILFFEI
jgi:hypothetical protein